MNSYALAVSLLNSGAEDLCDVPPSVMRDVALSLELLDTREAKYWFADMSNIKQDLKCLQIRAKLLSCAPPAAAASTLPSADYLREAIAINRRYESFMRVRKTIFLADTWIDDAIAECLRLRSIYELCLDCKCETYYIYRRREKLQELRETIGVAMFHYGFLPSPIPTAYLQRSD